jgi:hypothetical protein
MFLVEVWRYAGVQGTAVASAEHAGKDSGAGVDLLNDLAAGDDTDESATDAVGDPERALCVEGAAIRSDN